MYRRLLLICLLGITAKLRGQTPSKTVEYPFLFFGNPTTRNSMLSSNVNYLSTYGITSNFLHNSIGNKYTSILQGIAFFYLVPLTHEEGHRSILTEAKIGSISQPLFNSKGAAYVSGVRDAELKNLRDTNLPNYIRLHMAGLESDYMLINRVTSLACFDLDDYKKKYKVEFITRQYSYISYYLTGLIPDLVGDMEEEPNELDRDIVGHDIYGAIRHLHRPNMKFYRYTNYKDLTETELKYLKRSSLLSFLNFFNPLIFGLRDFELNNKTSISTGMSYMLSPIGDMVDMNLWLVHNDRLKMQNVVRLFHNNQRFFWSIGTNIIDYPIGNRNSLSINSNLWRQPNNLDFNTTKGSWGGAVDLLWKFRYSLNKKGVKAISLDMGLTAKTNGFLPEIVRLNEFIGFRIGTSVQLNEMDSPR